MSADWVRKLAPIIGISDAATELFPQSQPCFATVVIFSEASP